jgi:23S rRNA (adenine2503-C2)-methyltransferase
MGCAFCASGKDGLVRNLTAGEILAQVILLNKLNKPDGSGAAADNGVRRAAGMGCFADGGAAGKHARRGVTNIVLMGSGEPLDNFDEVMKFLDLVTCADGINVSARNISLSTSGLVPQIKKFADMGGQVNLCISLHAPNDGLRRQIMPIAKKYGVRELIDSAKYFFEKTHRRVIFEYSLIAKNGVPFNCTPEFARELADLVRGFPAHINLINLNAVKNRPPQNREPNAAEKSPQQSSMGSPIPPNSAAAKLTTGGGFSALFTPVGKEQAKIFMDAVIRAGVSCTMRKNRGGDIDGACGQLRLRYITPRRP